MSAVSLMISEDDQKKTPEEQLALLDQEVDAFSNFMATLGDSRARGALSHPERALVKTYLVAKIRGRI